MHRTLNLALAPVIYGRMLSLGEMNGYLRARQYYIDRVDQYVARRRAAAVEAYGQSPQESAEVEAVAPYPTHSHDQLH